MPSTLCSWISTLTSVLSLLLPVTSSTTVLPSSLSGSSSRSLKSKSTISLVPSNSKTLLIKSSVRSLRFSFAKMNLAKTSFMRLSGLPCNNVGISALVFLLSAFAAATAGTFVTPSVFILLSGVFLFTSFVIQSFLSEIKI